MTLLLRNRLGYALLNSGRGDEALTAYREAIALALEPAAAEAAE